MAVPDSIGPPDPIFFGGHVIGEEAVKKTEDVGSLVVFTLQVSPNHLGCSRSKQDRCDQVVSHRCMPTGSPCITSGTWKWSLIGRRRCPMGSGFCISQRSSSTAPPILTALIRRSTPSNSRLPWQRQPFYCQNESTSPFKIKRQLLSNLQQSD